MNVVVRVRPNIGEENLVACPEGNAITVRKEGDGTKCAALEFKFHDVFPPPTETETLYSNVLHPIVDNVLKGTPGCLFAYGQTGSGKTHTITGTALQPGLLPMAVGEILERTDSDPDVVTSCVYLTYLEIYNEVIKDLLNSEGQPLQLREDSQGRPHLPHMTRVAVGSVEDALAVVHDGEKCRAKAANSVHEHSSRSHAIFTITIETRRESESKLNIGLLHIIDLAGSETVVPGNQNHTVEVDNVVEARRALHDIGNRHVGEREARKASKSNREGSHIRKSLLALVRCVQKMAEGAPFIPFRDSTLTRLLRAPLEGNSNTAIVCTVNPHEGRETIATLRFAATAQRIHRTPANKVVSLSTEGSLLKSYERELAQLKEEMSRTLEDERRRAEDLKSVHRSNQFELEKAQADREALRQKLLLIESRLHRTQKRADGPPTPRTAAKQIAQDGTRPKRSGSAPHRRGAIFGGVASAEAVGVAVPMWLRDAANAAQQKEVKALQDALRDAKTAHESATTSSEARVGELESELARYRKAAKLADEERNAIRGFVARLAEEKAKKKGGFGCAGGKAAKTRMEDAPALHDFQQLLSGSG